VLFTRSQTPFYSHQRRHRAPHMSGDTELLTRPPPPPRRQPPWQGAAPRSCDQRSCVRERQRTSCSRERRSSHLLLCLFRFVLILRGTSHARAGWCEMCSGSEAGSYLRLRLCVSLNSRLESNKEETKRRTSHAREGWREMRARVRLVRSGGGVGATRVCSCQTRGHFFEMESKGERPTQVHAELHLRRE